MKVQLVAHTCATAAFALAGVLSLTACGSSESTTTPSVATSIPDPSSGVKTDLGLPAPTGEPELPGLRDQGPAAGTVERLTGPFDDRFDAGDVTLAKNALRGEIHITSDVSGLLALEVLAGFYDKSGRFLGSGRWAMGGADHHDHGGSPEADFAVAIPAQFRDKVASATWGVPVLVNE